MDDAGWGRARSTEDSQVGRESSQVASSLLAGMNEGRYYSGKGRWRV
jgi:hypothetical protein